jgi:hypothetical protein
VPDPDITSLPDSSSEDFESGSEVPDPTPQGDGLDCLSDNVFSSKIMGLETSFDMRLKPEGRSIAKAEHGF